MRGTEGGALNSSNFSDEHATPARVRPVEEDVTAIVAVSGHVRPAVVAARLDQIQLIVGAGAVLGRVELTRWTKLQALRVPVTVRIHVTAHAVQRRVVSGNRAVEIDAQNLAAVGGPVARGDLCGGGQQLRAVRQAVVAEEVGAVIAAAQIQLAVRTDHEPATGMVRAGWEIRDHVDGRGERLRGCVVQVNRRIFRRRAMS